MTNLLNTTTKVVLVSDGVTEAFDPNENQFGTERVGKVMAESSATSSRQLVSEFVDALARFRGSRPPFDDTTLLAARVGASHSSTPD